MTFYPLFSRWLFIKPYTTLLTEFCIINENGFLEISTSFHIFIFLGISDIIISCILIVLLILIQVHILPTHQYTSLFHSKIVIYHSYFFSVLYDLCFLICFYFWHLLSFLLFRTLSGSEKQFPIFCRAGYVDPLKFKSKLCRVALARILGLDVVGFWNSSTSTSAPS